MADDELTLIVNREEQGAEFEKRVTAVLQRYRRTLDTIADVLGAAGGLEPIEAEILLLWMAGTSHGMRGEPVTNELSMFTLARAWQYAASKVAN